MSYIGFDKFGGNALSHNVSGKRKPQNENFNKVFHQIHEMLELFTALMVSEANS